jgi:16S rRNA (adenine1518-N6/adenine1519-N6)-dimethyltransferase
MIPKKSYGQHFLVNFAAADAIVAAAEAVPGDQLLEIGPGRGVLTERMIKTGAHVTAIEADRDLEPQLRAKFPDLKLVMADATRLDFNTLEEPSYKLISNLPYNVSKPLLMRFFEDRKRFPRWVLMMQKEVADRLLASPGSKDWGPLGILLQNICTIKTVTQLGPGSFKPPPKVDSTVLRFDVREKPLEEMGDEKRFADMLFLLFRERRKTLNNRLKSIGVPAQPILEKHGFTGMERVESFDLKKVSALVRDVQAAISSLSRRNEAERNSTA